VRAALALRMAVKRAVSLKPHLQKVTESYALAMLRRIRLSDGIIGCGDGNKFNGVRMSNRNAEAPEAIVPFAKVKKTAAPVANADQLDTAGQAILGLLDRAAGIADANNQQALEVAQKLSVQLRASESRIQELEGEIRYHQDRADRAEKWLYQISVEIEQRFFTQGSGRPGDPPPPQAFIRNYGRRG
jgi:hypothetical protein